MDNIDYTPLLQTISYEEALAELPDPKIIWEKPERKVIVGFTLTTIALFAALFVVPNIAQNDRGTALTAYATLLGFGLISVYVTIYVIRNYLTVSTRARKAALLQRFAKSNNMQFFPNNPSPNLPALMTDTPRGTAIETYPRNGYFIEVGNAGFTYVVAVMSKRLPNIYLQSSVNSHKFGIKRYKLLLSQSQVQHLEGDFDTHFTTYTPKGYGVDSLAILTPDVMQIICDRGSEYDFELRNNKLYMLSQKRLDLADPQVLEGLLGTMMVIAKQFEEQADNYSDNRVVDVHSSFIAPAGQRLNQKVWVWIILGIVIATVLISAETYYATR